jgi:hypothetical protein
MRFPLVNIGEEVFWNLKSNGNKVVQWIQNLVMKGLGEGFNLC